MTILIVFSLCAVNPKDLETTWFTIESLKTTRSQNHSSAITRVSTSLQKIVNCTHRLRKQNSSSSFRASVTQSPIQSSAFSAIYLKLASTICSCSFAKKESHATLETEGAKDEMKKKESDNLPSFLHNDGDAVWVRLAIVSRFCDFPSMLIFSQFLLRPDLYFFFFFLNQSDLNAHVRFSSASSLLVGR